MARSRFGDGREGTQAAVETLEGLQLDVSPAVVARSSEAEALRAEIIEVGRKLWQRQYVDGNGGNISLRLGSRYVLCTPAMMSKADLTPEDLCLRSGRQRSCGRPDAGERDPAASRDLEGQPAGARGGAPPSAACHGLCDNGRGGAQWLRGGV